MPVLRHSDVKMVSSSANICDFDRRRTLLVRKWDFGKPLIGWLMLNPSTANAERNDPTILKTIGFTNLWGGGGVMVANMYDIRATDHKVLKHTPWDRSPQCDIDIGNLQRCKFVVVAWGAHASYRKDTWRINELRLLTKGMDLRCFGRSANGQPLHPLMLAYSTPLVPYEFT